MGFVNCVATDKFDIKHDNAYLYATANFLRNVIGTLGISYDSFEQQHIDLERVL